MKRIISCIVLSFFLVSLYAQTDNGKAEKVWTLKECVDYALANNLDVQRSLYNVEGYEVNNLQSIMAMVPNLNGNLSNGYNWGRSINPVTNEFITKQISTLSPNASSQVTLFNGLRLQNSVRQSVKDLAASEEDLAKAKNDVSLNVTNLYINVIFNKELLENAKFQLSSSQQQLERTRKQVAAGALSKSNELNLEAQVATNELAVINNENSLNLSLLQLKQALQLPATELLDIEIPDISVEDFVIDQSSQQIYEIARVTMPEIKSAELKVLSSRYALKAAKGNLYPRLSLSGSINSNYSSANDAITSMTPEGYGYRDQLKDNVFRSVSLSLSIPLFNGLTARSAVRRSVINQGLAEISAKQVSNSLRQNVETAFNDALAASKSYNSSLRQVQAREEAYRMTKQRFDAGAATYVEYQVAENDLFQAKSDLARAKYNFIFRKKLLDFYQGKPLEF